MTKLFQKIKISTKADWITEVPHNLLLQNTKKKKKKKKKYSKMLYLFQTHPVKHKTC